MVLCEKKIVTTNISGHIVYGILVLLSVYFLYNLEYPNTIAPALVFLQEKLAGFPVSRKLGITYSNLYRAVTLLEEKQAK